MEFIIIFIIYIGQGKFQDTKGETEAEDKQYNGQKKKNRRTNNDLQHSTQKTKEQREHRQIRG
jgi:hypothetical protein